MNEDTRSNRRRDWAVLLLAGGGMANTAICVACLYLIKDRPEYVFQLALAANVQIFVTLAGYAGLIVKQTFRAHVGKAGLEIENSGATS